MKLKFAILVGLLLTSVPHLVAAEPNEPGPSKSPVDVKRPHSTEDRLVAAVNKYRARHKLPPLKADPILMRLARQRAPFVDARRGAGTPGYNHQACGRWCRQHAREVGFTGPATDNLAMGYETPEGAVEGWASEDRDAKPAGHNYQMRGLASINGKWIDEGYDRIGVGIVGRNYIAIFGRGRVEGKN